MKYIAIAQNLWLDGGRKVPPSIAGKLKEAARQLSEELLGYDLRYGDYGRVLTVNNSAIKKIIEVFSEKGVHVTVSQDGPPRYYTTGPKNRWVIRVPGSKPTIARY